MSQLTVANVTFSSTASTRIDTDAAAANLKISIDSSNVYYANPVRTVFPTGTVNVVSELQASVLRGATINAGDLTVTGNVTSNNLSTGLGNIQIFTANGTYVKPAGVKAIKVICQGSGPSSSTSGTGAGGTTIKTINGPNIPASPIAIEVSVVSGGPAYSKVNTGTWGQAQKANSSPSLAPAINGDINISGQGGHNHNTGNPAPTPNSIYIGGISYLGSGFGSGGGGYGNPATITGATPGCVIIEEFY